MTTTSTEELREEVRRKYAEAAEAASKGSPGSCGSGSCCGTTVADADFVEGIGAFLGKRPPAWLPLQGKT